jgi:hypothetical protein
MAKDCDAGNDEKEDCDTEVFVKNDEDGDKDTDKGG